jgi:hypothetical protein
MDPQTGATEWKLKLRQDQAPIVVNKNKSDPEYRDAEEYHRKTA